MRYINLRLTYLLMAQVLVVKLTVVLSDGDDVGNARHQYRRDDKETRGDTACHQASE